MTDEEKRALTPEQRKKLGWFTADDPRRAVGGRARKTKSGKNLTEIAREDTEEAYAFIKSVMLDEAEKTKERLWAANFIITRGWGSPIHQINVDKRVTTETSTTQINVDSLSFDERSKLIHLFEQANNQPEIIEASYQIADFTERSDDDEY